MTNVIAKEKTSEAVPISNGFNGVYVFSTLNFSGGSILNKYDFGLLQRAKTAEFRDA